MSDWKEAARKRTKDSESSDWKEAARARTAPLPPLQKFDETGTQDMLRKVEGQELERLRLAEESSVANVLAPKTKLGTALRSAQRGVSMGFNDEIGGAMGATYEGLGRLGEYLGASPDDPYDAAHPEERPSLLDVYRRERDDTRRETERGAKENPTVSNVSELGAGLVMPPIGKGGRTAKALFEQGAKTAAFMGLGNSNADLTRGDVGGAALDTGLSSIIGGGASVGLGKAGQKVGGWLAPKLAKTAEGQAVKAGFGSTTINEPLRSRGYKTAEDVDELGREMLDRGWVKFFGGADKIAARSTDAREKLGAEAGDVMKRIDATGPVDAAALANRAENKLMDGALPDEVDASTKGLEWLDKIRRLNDQGGGAQDLNRMKSRGWQGVNVKDDAPLAASRYRQTVGAVRDEIGDLAEDRLGPEAGDQLRAANRGFGFAADVSDLANNEALRAAKRKNRIMGWLAAASMGGAGGLSGGAQTGVVGAALGLAPFVGREILSPNRLAVGADALSRYAAEAGGGSGAAKLARAGTEEFRRYLLEHAPKPGEKEAQDHYINGG